jgi:V8-like Glu-specific endopeptidase
MLILDRDIGRQAGWYGIASPSDDLLSELNINVTGYPGEKGNGRLRGTSMYNMKGKVSSYTAEEFQYTIDTTPGQSGGSAWAKLNQGGLYCCGVHNSERTNVINTASRITDDKFSTLLGWMNDH